MMQYVAHIALRTTEDPVGVTSMTPRVYVPVACENSTQVTVGASGITGRPLIDRSPVYEKKYLIEYINDAQGRGATD